MKHLLTVAILLVGGCSHIGDTKPDAPTGAGDAASADAFAGLDRFIQAQMKSMKMPGLACCIVKNGRVAWAKGYGWANVQTKQRVTEDTLFTIASVSKTVTGTAVMQLCERGAIDLDGAVNDHLPFKVCHPKYPDVPITFRMLLTHTSGIQDSDAYREHYTLGRGGGDSPIALGDFLKMYLLPKGSVYDPEENFTAHKPGTRHEYSNVGYALLGYLVETIAKMPFNEYCKTHIFAPLEMTRTGWFLSEIDTSKLAMPYRPRGRSYTPLGHYGFPTYPDGLLRTSVKEYARFILAYLNKGTFHGKTILSPETVAEMLTPQIPQINEYQGITWVLGHRDGHDVAGNAGGDPGVRTGACFLPEKGTGVVLFGNCHVDVDTARAWAAIARKMIQCANADR